MKPILRITVALFLLICLSACTTQSEAFVRTKECQALLDNLTSLHTQGYMFGHHDDTLYGIGWEGDDGRSDVKSVCGDYPAVISFDLGRIELGGDRSLDKIPFDVIRHQMVEHYNRGGVVSVSWHLDNPLTDGTSWDVSDSGVVASILEGGANHIKFLGWLDTLGRFLSSVEDANGVKVPIIFRPWHEHTGSWFWWGQDLCSAEEYIALWRLTYDHMASMGVNNLIYAYSAAAGFKSEEEYTERYPGDDVVDILGFDAYQYNDNYVAILDESLRIVESLGAKHNKPIAVTETGYETIPDSEWWTKSLQATIERYPICYVLVWRNARERDNHYYAPYPTHHSVESFMEFYNDDKTLFVNDLDNLYK